MTLNLISPRCLPFKRLLIFRKKNYKANVQDYEYNLVTNLDVLQALTAYQDTQRSLEKIRYQAKIDYNQLEASVAHHLSWMEVGQDQ